MHTVQGNLLFSLQTVQTFLNDHAAMLPDVTKSGARKELDDAIAELTTYRSDQRGSFLSAQGTTQTHQSLRLVLLRHHMAPIARIARAKLPRTPELAPLRMPRGRPNLVQLVDAARGMAKAAAPFAAVFTTSGLPADFLTQLDAVATALLRSADDRTQLRGKAKGATAGLATTLRSARKTLLVIDAFVQIALENDPVLLANWRTVKRVPSTRGRTTPVSPEPVSAGTTLIN